MSEASRPFVVNVCKCMYNSTTHNHKKPRLRDRTDRAWLVAFYVIRPGNVADLFLQPRSRTAGAT